MFARDDVQAKVAASLLGSGKVKRSKERARPADVKYYLSRGPLKMLPMTPLQAMRLNASLTAAEAKRLTRAPLAVN